MGTMEQRKFPRYQKRLPTLYEVQTGPVEQRTHKSITLNVSREGCTLVTGDHTELAGPLLVTLTLELPSKESVRLYANIIWAHPPKLSPARVLIVHGTMGLHYEPNQAVPDAYEAFLAQCEAELSG